MIINNDNKDISGTFGGRNFSSNCLFTVKAQPQCAGHSPADWFAILTTSGLTPHHLLIDQLMKVQVLGPGHVDPVAADRP